MIRHIVKSTTSKNYTCIHIKGKEGGEQREKEVKKASQLENNFQWR